MMQFENLQLLPDRRAHVPVQRSIVLEWLLYVFGINMMPAFLKKNNLEQGPLGNDSLARRMNSGSSCRSSRCWRRTRCQRKRMSVQLNTYRVPHASVLNIIIMIVTRRITSSRRASPRSAPHSSLRARRSTTRTTPIRCTLRPR